MKLCWLLIFSVCSGLLSLADASGWRELDHIHPQASVSTQTAAARALVKRLLPMRYQDFNVVVNPDIGTGHLDTFQVSSDGRTVSVTGTTGVAAAWGVQHYLVHYCDCHLAWEADQLTLPPPGQLPVIQPAVKVTSPNRFRYYQNVCTVSYTFAWWDWSRWERHIDWMALSGINLPLAFNGQEAIWQKVYLKMGLKQHDLDQHFGGPAFLAWARMGNLDGWGGPLPQAWHTYQLSLQNNILSRMRSLGMIPVLPGFAGHVPKTFSQYFPNANISHLGDWGHLPPEYCCTSLLDPGDPMFKQVGKAFIEALSEEFNGTDHIYNADTFNENQPSSSDPAYLSAASRGVYEGIIAGDPQGVWLMQGWLFQNSGFWGPTQIKALLHGVPIGRMIVLDLFAEARPTYNRTESFYGQPFIWCMLHNFGGNTGLYGKLDAVNQEPFKARQYNGSTMIGMGLTPEGILQNYVMYNFLNDMTWRSESTNVTDWIAQYAGRRYREATVGTMSKAWGILRSTVYENGPADHNHPPVVLRPSNHMTYTRQEQGNIHAAMAWDILRKTVYGNTGIDKDHQCAIVVRRATENMFSKLWYDYTKVAEAWNLLVKAASALQHSTLFRYDLVDVTRNVLQDLAFDFYEQLMHSFEAKNTTAVKANGTLLCDLILDMDNITSSHEDWLLGTWLEQAKARATNLQEEILYEFNARNQLTLWGPAGNIVDYANKQWGGILRTYYHGRWQLFVAYLLECLNNDTPYNQTTFDTRSFTLETAWVYGRNVFPTTPVGDSVSISQALLQKYQLYIQQARHSGKAAARIGKKKDRCGFQESIPFSYQVLEDQV